MRYLTLMLFLVLSGCIPYTQAQISAFSGTVIDGNSGYPLEGVRIVDIKKDTQKAKSFVTTANGYFFYSDINSDIASQLPAPGAKELVMHTLSFKKQGYRDTDCSCTNMPLSSKKSNAKIPLLKVSESTAAAEPAIFLSIGETDIVCQVFIGSPVIYEEQKYRLEKINRREECGFEYLVFTLVSETGERIDVSETNAITLTGKY